MFKRLVRVTVVLLAVAGLSAASPIFGDEPRETLEQRVERLEKLLAETRAELAAAKAAAGADPQRLREIEREIEVEHAVSASDKGGEVEVEFAYLDYLFSKSLRARAGLMLIPMGLVNELHEPPTFLGALRPDVEERLIPSTWRELGAGVYGDA